MKIVLLFALVLITAFCNGQDKTENKGVPSKVTNWGMRGLMFTETFYNETKDSIIAQIGIDEFEKVKVYCSVLKWPSSMQPKFGRMNAEEQKTMGDRLDKLHMYKIAAYQHYYDGKKMERFSILRVPYEENKNWDSTAKWDTVYFVVQEEESVKELKIAK